MRTFENIAFAFFAGMTNAASVVIGQDIGSGRLHAGVKNASRFMVAVPLLGIIFGAFILPFRGEMVHLFNLGGSISETTLSAARGILLIYAVELCVRNICYVTIVGVFRAGGDTKNGMKFEMKSLWCVSIPVTFLAAFVLKLPFVAVFACSYLCEDYLKAFLCLRHFRKMEWIKPVTEEGQRALRAFRAGEEEIR